MRPRGTGTIPKPTLEKLFLRQNLSGMQIAEKLGVPKDQVYKDLKGHGLWGQKPTEPDDPRFDKLKSGVSVEITAPAGVKWVAGWMRRRARQRGYRITLKKIDDRTYRVTRKRTAEE